MRIIGKFGFLSRLLKFEIVFSSQVSLVASKNGTRLVRVKVI